MPSYRKILFSSVPTVLALGVGLLVLMSCGNNYYGTASAPTGPSKYKHKMYVTNSFNGTILIINADNDQVFGRNISTVAGSNLLVETPDKTKTLSFSSGAHQLSIIDNTTDDILASSTPIALPDDAQSIVALADNKTAMAAVRNMAVPSFPRGGVEMLDLTNFVVAWAFPVPAATRVVANHAGTKVLAFSDNTDSFAIIDPVAKTSTTISNPASPAAPTLDRPVYAIFSSDDSKAYILNCGAECGGTAASITVLNTSDNSMSTPVPVPAATIALLDSSGKLYVAGTANGAGVLSVLDSSNLAPPSTTAAISDGYHSQIGMSNNGHLYIGATNCSNATLNGAAQGCLSMYNTSANSVVISSNPGSITGIAPIAGRNTVYVCQNGELVIYDSTTDTPQAANQVDIVGTAGDVIQVQ